MQLPGWPSDWFLHQNIVNTDIFQWLRNFMPCRKLRSEFRPMAARFDHRRKLIPALVITEFSRRWRATLEMRDASAFMEFVQLCFAQKRKTLVNNLRAKFAERKHVAKQARLTAGRNLDLAEMRYNKREFLRHRPRRRTHRRSVSRTLRHPR